MNEIAADLRVLLVRELKAFEREVEMFPDDELVWKTVPGVTNSAGNLALHVCGNLQHFVGRVLGDTNYVRDRELEFSRSSGSRAELAREIRTHTIWGRPVTCDVSLPGKIGAPGQLP